MLERRRRWTFPLTGAVAGVVSAVAFAGIHALVISDIWFFVVPMIVVGAICGLCVAGTFGILVCVPTVRRWLLYNSTFVGLFVLLGIVSVAIYEPVTTISALLALSGPPEHLFREVMPLSVGFTLAGAALITVLFGRRWWHVAPALVTVAVLTLFLGLNISIMGLVELSASSAYVVSLNFGLILAIVVVYAGAFLALEWSTHRQRPGGTEGSGIARPVRGCPRAARSTTCADSMMVVAAGGGSDTVRSPRAADARAPAWRHPRARGSRASSAGRCRTNHGWGCRGSPDARGASTVSPSTDVVESPRPCAPGLG